MNRKIKNIFSDGNVVNPESEFFDVICEGKNTDFLLERIISIGNITPEGKWYEQNNDEWVVVMKGEGVIEFFDGEIIKLSEGDSIMIKAGDKHKVIYTSIIPVCIWLALHFKNNA